MHWGGNQTTANPALYFNGTQLQSPVSSVRSNVDATYYPSSPTPSQQLLIPTNAAMMMQPTVMDSPTVVLPDDRVREQEAEKAKRDRRRKWIWVATTAAIVLAAVVGAILIWHLLSADHHPEPGEPPSHTHPSNATETVVVVINPNAVSAGRSDPLPNTDSNGVYTWRLTAHIQNSASSATDFGSVILTQTGQRKAGPTWILSATDLIEYNHVVTNDPSLAIISTLGGLVVEVYGMGTWSILVEQFFTAIQ